jgi:hypothetical protein
MGMNYTILKRDELPHDGNVYEFQAFQYQDKHAGQDSSKERKTNI